MVIFSKLRFKITALLIVNYIYLFLIGHRQKMESLPAAIFVTSYCTIIIMIICFGRRQRQQMKKPRAGCDTPSINQWIDLSAATIDSNQPHS